MFKQTVERFPKVNKQRRSANGLESSDLTRGRHVDVLEENKDTRGGGGAL